MCVIVCTTFQIFKFVFHSIVQSLIYIFLQINYTKDMSAHVILDKNKKNTFLTNCENRLKIKEAIRIIKVKRNS